MLKLLWFFNNCFWTLPGKFSEYSSAHVCLGNLSAQSFLKRITINLKSYKLCWSWVKSKVSYRVKHIFQLFLVSFAQLRKTSLRLRIFIDNFLSTQFFNLIKICVPTVINSFWKQLVKIKIIWNKEIDCSILHKWKISLELKNDNLHWTSWTNRWFCF